MTVGMSATNLANVILSWLGGTAETAPSALYVALHTADPGSAGTTSASTVTTRSQLALGTPSAGSVDKTSTDPSWSMTATETISHLSVWDASTSGNFLLSVALTTSKDVVDGDTLKLTSFTAALTPIAA